MTTHERTPGLEEWRDALVSLTPGGSDFLTPERCRDWAHERWQSTHYIAVKNIKERNELRNAHDALVAALEAMLEATSHFQTFHMDARVVHQARAALKLAQGDES